MTGSKRTTAPVTAGRSRKKQMSWSSRVVLLALALTALFALPGLAQAAGNPSADLDQCANGSLAAPNVPACDPTEWVNGNLGSSKAHYFEGDSVPYRMKFDNLSLSSHTVTIQWDTTKSDKHALDYLTSFDRTVTTANPCAGILSCGSPATFPIPNDPQVSGALVAQIGGVFTLYGGTITSVSPYTYSPAGFFGDTSASITITFTASVVNPVLAWGGHIATRADWGPTNAATAIPGSPYHMRLLDLDGAGGNQDRSLSADAVIFPGSITIVKDAVPNDSQVFSFTAGPAPLADFTLFDDGNTANNTKIFSNITTFQAYTVTEAANSSWTLSLGNPVCTVTSPNGGSQTGNVGTRTISITLAEGENVSCTFTNTRNKLQPTIATTASAATTVGGSISDSVVLSGGLSPTGSITVKVYGPDDATCSNAPAFTDVITPLSGNGTYASPSHVITTAGTYRFWASYSGDANNLAVAGACNQANESVVVGPKQPAIATTASAAVEVGGSISDSVVLSGGSSPSGSITVKVYGPDDATCSNAALFTDVITPLSGNGTYASPSHVITTAGTYRFWASYSGDANNLAVAGACNQANESVVVGPKHPAIATTASAATTVGGSISDSVVLSGGLSPSGSITVKVYGPNDATCSNAPAFTDVITPLTGNGTYASPSHVITTAGTYRFWASYSGDANNAAVVGACNQANESVVVGPAGPAIATTASATVEVGGSISDSVVLSGGSSPTGTITVKVYGPNDATCSNAAAFTDVITVDSGNGTYASPAHVINTAGTYRFWASYSGDNNNTAVAGACNQANESVVVSKAAPAVATTASDAVEVGGSISDSVVLSGGFSPTGTLTVKVYGPNDADCSGAAAFTNVIAVNSGNGTYASPAHVINTAGTYRFWASYSGDVNNSAVAGACNLANESVVVRPAGPAVATTASDSVEVGGSISDSVVLSGGVSPTGTITVKVYGPNDADCSGAAAFTDVITVDSGNGTYASPAHVINTAGTYRFWASYSGDNNNTAVAGACNQENESVVVSKATPTLSTDASADVVIGGKLSDVAHLGGGFNPTGTITFNLYGPNNSECTGEPVFTSTKTVQGSGNYTSAEFTAAAAGTYRWVASYSGDENNNSATGACGDENESATVFNPSISITKNPKSQAIPEGGNANFTITVTNTGDIALSNVQVTDAQAPNCAKAIGDLAPGASVSYDCVLANVQSSFTNSATATGHPAVGPDVTATDTAPVTVNSVPPPPPPPPVIPTPPAPKIDLQITKADNPDPDVLGTQVRYLIVVKNNGPDTAHNVQMSDPLPFQVTFSSVTTTQGTCTGGQLISCQLGTIASGASVTVTVFVKTNSTGLVTNTATTVGTEAETNTANNTATTTTLVQGPFKPPVVPTGCYAVAVTPHSLTAGKRTTLVLSVHMLGKPAKNARVKVTGAGISKTSGPTNAKGIVRISVKPAKPGILRFQPVAHAGCGAPRIGVIGAFTPPVTG